MFYVRIEYEKQNVLEEPQQVIKVIIKNMHILYGYEGFQNPEEILERLLLSGDVAESIKDLIYKDTEINIDGRIHKYEIINNEIKIVEVNDDNS